MDQLASGNLIAITRNKRLEHALVDGVEHSRAAREFLDSMIEMENPLFPALRSGPTADPGGRPSEANS